MQSESVILFPLSTIQKSRPNLTSKASIRERIETTSYNGYYCKSILSHKEMGITSVHSFYLQHYRQNIGNNTHVIKVSKENCTKEQREVGYFCPGLRNAELCCVRGIF